MIIMKKEIQAQKIKKFLKFSKDNSREYVLKEEGGKGATSLKAQSFPIGLFSNIFSTQTKVSLNGWRHLF